MPKHTPIYAHLFLLCESFPFVHVVATLFAAPRPRAACPPRGVILIGTLGVGEIGVGCSPLAQKAQCIAHSLHNFCGALCVVDVAESSSFQHRITDHS